MGAKVSNFLRKKVCVDKITNTKLACRKTHLCEGSLVTVCHENDAVAACGTTAEAPASAALVQRRFFEVTLHRSAELLNERERLVGPINNQDVMLLDNDALPLAQIIHQACDVLNEEGENDCEENDSKNRLQHRERAQNVIPTKLRVGARVCHKEPSIPHRFQEMVKRVGKGGPNDAHFRFVRRAWPVGDVARRGAWPPLCVVQRHRVHDRRGGEKDETSAKDHDPEDEKHRCDLVRFILHESVEFVLLPLQPLSLPLHAAPNAR